MFMPGGMGSMRAMITSKKNVKTLIANQNSGLYNSDQNA
jgi:hypothetical protein